MNNIIERLWNQNKMVQIEDLKGSLFQDESSGHTFKIYGIDDAGNTVSLSGTPSGIFHRPDNTDVTLSCSVSGGVVSATLPSTCYDVPGRGGITVFLTSNSQKTAIYAAVATVTRTESGTVAPPATQNVVDLINAISAAVATIPASYSNLMADIAPTYSTSALYAVGQYAWYDGDLKRCIVPITTAESYTAAHWTSAVLGNDVSDLKSALSQMADIPDAVRAKNMTEGAQYASDYTYEGVTVHAVPYSGFKLTGRLASSATCYLCHGVIPFEYGKYYTFIVLTNDTTSKINFGFRSTSPAQWVQDTDNVSIRTLKRNEAYTFTPKQTFETCYIAILNNTASTVTLDDTYYVYVVEGQYTTEQLSVARDLLTQAGNVSYNESQFVNKKVDAINANTWQSLDYADAMIYKDHYFMNSDGDAILVGEHCVLQIPDASGIYRIRFVLKTANSNPLFIVKDSNGTVRNVLAKYWGDSDNSKYINKDLYLVFPGGLAEGSTIYMNWYYKNVPSRSDDYIDHIDIQYEKQFTGKIAGKDLLDMTEAVTTGHMYFSKDDGHQYYNEDYYAGEARIKAGDVISTYMNCHIACFDQYGAYVGGVAQTGSTYHQYTAPEGTHGAMISFKNADTFRIGCNEHFTIPINQNIIAHNENSADYVDNETDMVNVNAIFVAPMTYTKDGEPTPLIVIIHGSGFGVSTTEWGSSDNGSIISSSGFNKLIKKFLQSGYAVCDINGYNNSVPNNTWGSQRGVMAYRKLIDYVLARYNVQKMVNIYAFSMGGLVALNFMNMNRDIVKCAAIASPVVSLHDQAYASNTWKPQIQTSYGFAEGTDWDDNLNLVQGYDPFERFIDVNGKEYDISNYPFMRIWHGTADTVSPQLSAELVQAIRNGGHDCTYRAVTDAGHEICYGANAKCNDEYVYWFNRFNRKDV